MSTHVAVLMGGWSSEREVSLVSGAACAKGLQEAGYSVTTVDIQRDMGSLLTRLYPKPDVIFNALHGPYGEDGCIQGFLNIINVPYTHSGVLASSIAMDKPMAKRLFEEAGIPCAKHVIAKRDEVLAGDVMERPYVIKPANEGSSVGVKVVFEGDEPPFSHDDWPYGETVMVEQFIAGRELTVAVMGDQGALGVTEIGTDHKFYDYDAKYADGGSWHEVPAKIPADIEERVKKLSEIAHNTLGCRGVSRADFRYDEEKGELYILEINTQPGMTPTSLVPEQAAAADISFPKLVAWMVEEAQCDS
ncbi:D-alanine:D-alanine ligase [Candidatus Terasakiella magnetica]|uniref:D-alanine--D-alanine ligase n=1 Tax=Candidatus Terasakiella magnetica TaxID=1867952 RepID=A0A1C3RJK0_9PROT|nr:D-alanine--D-alanine ligase [Candidatus Terasakiella magnetica]SCA57407.1 D-alanine:D-alanine ligase [Candidatus Terasakiella magnetica]